LWEVIAQKAVRCTSRKNLKRRNSMRKTMTEARLRQISKDFEKSMRRELLQIKMQRLINTYGLCTVLEALSDEAARMILNSYCPDAVKIHDVLRACQEEICDQGMK
jgi:hypothetical protein